VKSRGRNRDNIEKSVRQNPQDRGSKTYAWTEAARARYMLRYRMALESTGERKKLQESEERFRLLVESVRDYAIFMLDPEGRVLTWNAGAERFKGYKANEIIGQHFSIFYTDDAKKNQWPEHELRVAKEKGTFEDEGWRVRKDGTLFWANVVITTLRDRGGEFIGFAKVTRDLSQRRAH
jgi:PAS domain S-box-containing protein